MSDSAYGWTYFGLNLASSVEQIVGNGYRLYKTRTPRISRTGEISGYRYFDKFGNPFFDFDYPHINVSYNHWHGWGGPGLQGRTKGHWGFLD